MIVKHVAMRTVRRSSFVDLAGYITNPQDKSERLGAVSITHCHSTTLDDALVEIQAVQGRNTRSTDDKTYHLIISFRAEEHPSKEVLRAIEQQVCDGLGFGDHQRVSAVHGDTDNLHVHIAINKIHPTRYTIHTPFNAYWTLARLCERLEIEHGLQKDNHQAQKLGPKNKAADMERHSGIQSLIGWVQAECLNRITTASSWAVLHETLREHGLELRERGNGFVIGDGAGTQAKASSIDRSLSRARLEIRLGPFEPARRASAEPQFDDSSATSTPSALSSRPQYDKKPVRSKIDTTALYVQYQQEREGMAAARTAESRILRQRQQAELAAVQDASRLRRSTIGLMGENRLARKVLYALASRASKSDLAKVREQHALERRALQQKYVRRVWRDWLQVKAVQGDPVALGVLHAQKGRQGLKGNVLSAMGPKAATSGPASRPDHMTKTGTVIYHRGSSAIRDDGERLQVARGTDWQGLDAALRLAVQRYGDRLTVSGTDDFKSRVVIAAAAAALPLTFSDALLEQRRLALSSNLSRKPAHDPPDRRRPHVGGADIAQSWAAHGGRAEHAGIGAEVRRQGPDIAAQSVGGSFGSASTSSSPNGDRPAQRGKPHVGRAGSQPPPSAKNRLRNLSELGVVQFARGGEVLLPGDVPSRLEQPGPQPDHALRRPVTGAGEGLAATTSAAAAATVVAVAAEDAVAKFITERDAKRSSIDDIPKYRRYTEVNETPGHYAGTCSVDGQLLALLQREEAVDVLTIDAATSLRLKRFRIGDAITVALRARTTGCPAGPTPGPTYTFKPQTGRTIPQKKRSR